MSTQNLWHLQFPPKETQQLVTLGGNVEGYADKNKSILIPHKINFFFLFWGLLVEITLRNINL